MGHRVALLLLACAIIAVGSPARASDSPASIPSIVVEGVPFDIKVESADLEAVPFAIMIIHDDEVVYTQRGIIPATIRNVRVPSGGQFELSVSTAGETWETPFRALAGWLSLLPALFAILMALAFRQVYVALFAGVWLGGFIIKGFNPWQGFFYVVDHYVVNSLAGPEGWDHTSIAVFTLLLGGIVGIVSANGGAAGIVKSVSRLATNAKRGQFATWLMGLLIFFDDYTNTLIVGNTMRPVTDKLRISREKLAYIVDSTAAPVACVAIITSWIGFEISLLKDAFESVGMIDRNPLTTFIASIQYSYYPILTLLFVLLIALLGRDYGPMLTAERRARFDGLVLRPGAVPLSDIDSEVSEKENVPERWFNAVVPVMVVVLGTVYGLLETGKLALAAEGVTNPSLFEAMREGNSFVALLWSSFAGVVVAILLTVAQRILSLTQAVSAFIAGVKAMAPAIVILVLAWSIGAVCKDLYTANYLLTNLSGVIAPELLPMLTFLAAAAVSFSTGTSWGTMTILTPLCVPLIIQVTQLHDMSVVAQDAVLLEGIAAILSGAVFGDHCSPISDTTIMSSMACTSDHIDHVRTQLPYAITVAMISMLIGYVPVALGVPAGVVLLVGSGVVFLVVRFFGRKVEASTGG